MDDSIEMFKKYLIDNGAKEELRKMISDKAEKYKLGQAYRWHRGDCMYDYSGDLSEIYGKTIGDIRKTEKEVLASYTGDRIPTYMSGCGFRNMTVAEAICPDIASYFCEMVERFIIDNKENVCKDILDSGISFSKQPTEETVDKEYFYEYLGYWGETYSSIFNEIFGKEYYFEPEVNYFEPEDYNYLVDFGIEGYLFDYIL